MKIRRWNLNKIVTVIMGQNCEKFIGMALESIKDSDAIVYLDGGSTDNTLKIVKEHKEKATSNFSVMYNKYNQIDKMMNGKQRNIYLNYVREKYPDYWCLALDADEIVDGLGDIKELINRSPPAIYSVKMRHLIGNFGHEDATIDNHFVPNRLFKVSEVDKYPEVEHPVLQGKPRTQQILTDCTTVWHLAYVPGMWDIKKRYENHMKKSEMHTTEFLKKWYWSHLFGRYPIKEIKLIDLPKILLDEFGIDRDEFYFQGRSLEIKHSHMVIQWNRYFEPNNVLDLGCGIGPYLYYWKLLGKEVRGLELSNWAVKHAIVPNIQQGDITDFSAGGADLITAIDVLEHIDYDKIQQAIENICKSTEEHLLVSVPVIGDPNLENDKTHKIKESKEWWIKQFTKRGLVHLPTPEDWMFKEQLFIFRRKDE